MIDFAEFEMFLSYICHILLMLTCLYEDYSKLWLPIYDKIHFSLFKFITISSCFLCDYSQNKLWVEARETWKEKYHGTDVARSLSRGEREQNWGEMVGNPRRKGMDGK